VLAIVKKGGRHDGQFHTSTGVILQRGDNAMVKMAVASNHRDLIRQKMGLHARHSPSHGDDIEYGHGDLKEAETKKPHSGERGHDG
jgi:hypothetical protein